jgi:hypothetical protein
MTCSGQPERAIAALSPNHEQESRDDEDFPRLVQGIANARATFELDQADGGPGT